MSGWYAWQQDRLVLRIYVQTRASRNEITGVQGDYLKVRLTAAPVDGKANAHLIAFLAEQCELSQSAVCLLSGASSRHKRLCLTLKEHTLPEVFSRFVNSVEQSERN